MGRSKVPARWPVSSKRKTVESDQTQRKAKKASNSTSQNGDIHKLNSIKKFNNHFATKRYLKGRFLDLPFTASDIPMVYQWISKLKLKPIFDVKEHVYPNLMRLFYCNFRVDSEFELYTISSVVKGVPIVLDCNLLGDILGIPHRGTMYYDASSGWFEGVNGFDPESAMKIILGKDVVNGRKSVSSNMLGLDMKYLHRMICQIIVPKSGKFDKLSKLEVLIMWHIATGTHINIPYLMLRHMDHVVTKGLVLPYGSFLTKIFKHFKVPLDNEVLVKMTQYDIINQSTLKLMHYFKENGDWILRKGKEVDVEEEDADTEDESDRAVEEDRVDQASPSQEMMNLLVGISTRLDDLNTRMDGLNTQLNTRMDGLDTRVDGLQVQMTEMYTLMTQHFASPPPSLDHS